MSAPRTRAGAVDGLCAEPWRYPFFQAVRLLLRQASTSRGALPRRVDRVVRFESLVSRAFPQAEVAAVQVFDDSQPQPDGALGCLQVAFFGMAGQGGVLPEPYVSAVIEQTRGGDTSLAAFLDLIFNQRLLSFFYRSWEKHRFWVPYERGEADPATGALYALIGLRSGKLRAALPYDAERLLPLAGRLSRRPVSLSTMRSVLRLWLGDAAFELRQFEGRWLELEPESLCRLDGGGVLGMGCVLGARVWDSQGEVCLSIKALSWGEVDALLPGAHRATELQQLICALAGGQLGVRLELCLKPGQAPGARLGTHPSNMARLGQTSFLGCPPHSGAVRLSFDKDGLLQCEQHKEP